MIKEATLPYILGAVSARFQSSDPLIVSALRHVANVADPSDPDEMREEVSEHRVSCAVASTSPLCEQAAVECEVLGWAWAIAYQLATGHEVDA